MKINRVSVYFVVLFATALPQLAEADADSWYGALALGQTGYDVNAHTVPSYGSPDGSSVTDGNSRAYSGGYRFNRYFSVEGGHINLGAFNAIIYTFSGTPPFGDGPGAIEDASATGNTLDAVALLPLGDVVSLFGRAGLFRYHYDLSGDSPIVCPPSGKAGTGSCVSESSGTAHDYGAGVSFAITERFSLRLGYSKFRNVGDPNTGQTTLRNTYLQLVVDFF